MSEDLTKKWRELFKKNCSHWPDDQKLRFLNIPNDRDDIDEVEWESSVELVTEINGEPPKT